MRTGRSSALRLKTMRLVIPQSTGKVGCPQFRKVPECRTMDVDDQDSHVVILQFQTKNSKFCFDSEEITFRIKLVLKRTDTLLPFLARFALQQGKLFSDSTEFALIASNAEEVVLVR